MTLKEIKTRTKSALSELLERGFTPSEVHHFTRECLRELLPEKQDPTPKP